MRDSAEFQNAKRLAAGMRPLTAQQIAQAQRNGGYSAGSAGAVSRTDVMPSGNFREFQHQAYTITYPDNWQVFGSNTSSATIAPRAGVANNSVTYGVIIDGFQPQNSSNLDDATNELLQRLQQGNSGMRIISSGQTIRVNGMTGRSVEFVTNSGIRDTQGRTQRERDWLVTLPFSDNTVIYLVFIAPEQDFETLRSRAFEPMLRSLRLQQG
jgi:hypothetical protein